MAGQWEDGGMMRGWQDDGTQQTTDDSTPAMLSAILGTWGRVEGENGVAG